MNYASTIEDISPTRRKFKISVPKNIVAETFEKVILDLQQTSEVRGFRKGKVPVTLVRKFFDSDIRKRVIEKIIEDSYGNAVKQANIQIVSQPQIEPMSNLSETEDFSFDAVVDVNPPIEIQGYKELVLKSSAKNVSDEDVEATLKNLSNALAKFEKVTEDRPIQDHDSVTANISYSHEGKPLSQLARKGQRINLSNPQTLPEFKNNLIGAKVGETKEFQIPFADDYAEEAVRGKNVTAKVEITTIENMIMPEFDEAFAKRLGFDSMETTKRSIMETMMRTEESRKLEAFGEQIIEQLLAKNTFEAPEALIENTIDRQIAEENMRLEKSKHLDTKDATVRAKYRETAKQSVQAILALGNIARMENISVDDKEIGPELFAIAQSMGIGVEELVKKGGRLVIDEARGRVLINKTIKHLVGINKVEMA